MKTSLVHTSGNLTKSMTLDYLRSTTMTQARFNHLMVTHVHKDITDNLNIVDIAKAFVSLNDRQSAFFGHFK